MDGLQFSLSSPDILEAIPDALLVADKAGKIAFVNTQLVKLFGYPRHELIGCPLDKLMPEQFRHAHPLHVAGYVKAPHIRPMGDCSGFYGLRKTGEEFPVEIYLSPLYANDVMFIMAAIRDITRRKQLEEELRKSRDELDGRVRARTAELEDTARRLQTEIDEHARSEERILQLQAELSHISRLSVIGEMVSGLGHELNQPLAAINNYAQGCIRRLHAGKTDNADFADALQRISREASRASEIIERFRRFAKREQLQREWVSVDALVCDAIRLSELEFARHGVKMDLRLSGVMPQVFIDPIQIQQVIVNLVRNAIESTLNAPQGERAVSIQASSPDSDSIRVNVRDNGHGLLVESVNHLFQPFFTTKANGLGMGLSLSRRIIETHGGELSAQANGDQGMTFSFVLPVSGAVSHVQ